MPGDRGRCASLPGQSKPQKTCTLSFPEAAGAYRRRRPGMLLPSRPSMVSVVVCLVLGLVLVAAAGFKAAGGASARAALSHVRHPFAATSRTRRGRALIAVEVVLGVLVGAGLGRALQAAALLIAGACGVQVAAIWPAARVRRARASGHAGRLSSASAGRAAALAAALALAPMLPRGDADDRRLADDRPRRPRWLGLVALSVVVLALAREVGMLRLSVAPRGALEVAHEGPEVGAFSPLAGDVRVGARHSSGSPCSRPRAAACVACWRRPSRRSARTRAVDAAHVRRGPRRRRLGRRRRPRQPVRGRAGQPTARCSRRGRSTPARNWSPCSRPPSAGAEPSARERGRAIRRRRRGGEFAARVPRAGRGGGDGGDRRDGDRVPWSRPARPRPTTSAATSTRPTRARTRPGFPGSTARDFR